MGPTLRLVIFAITAATVSAILFSEVVPASSSGSIIVPVMSGHNETTVCAVLYAVQGASGSVMARNTASVPVDLAIEIGGQTARLRLSPGQEDVVARLSFEGTGVYMLRITAWPLEKPAGIEPLDINVAVEGSKRLTTIHYALFALPAAALGGASISRLLSSRGLASRLEPAVALGLAGGLIFPASRAGVDYGFTMISCGSLKVACPADAVISEALRPAVNAGEPLVLLAVIVGSLAVMYEPGYAVEYYDAMLASMSSRRILLYMAAAYLSMLAGILASLAGVGLSTGRFQLALAVGVSKDTLLVGASWVLHVALLVGTALVASAGLGAALRRSRWVGVLILLALLAVPGELFSIKYGDCPDYTWQMWAARKGEMLITLALLAPVFFVLRWRRR